jgi:hypothetical protein
VEGLISRVQLLQDAVTGIISIDQNDIVKVLTIASVVGIPPILVVGIYGMNFQVYAGTELVVGLSLRSGPDRRFDRLAPPLVQNEGLDVIEAATVTPPHGEEARARDATAILLMLRARAVSNREGGPCVPTRDASHGRQVPTVRCSSG